LGNAIARSFLALERKGSALAQNFADQIHEGLMVDLPQCHGACFRKSRRHFVHGIFDVIKIDGQILPVLLVSNGTQPFELAHEKRHMIGFLETIQFGQFRVHFPQARQRRILLILPGQTPISQQPVKVIPPVQRQQRGFLLITVVDFTNISQPLLRDVIKDRFLVGEKAVKGRDIDTGFLCDQIRIDVS